MTSFGFAVVELNGAPAVAVALDDRVCPLGELLDGPVPTSTTGLLADWEAWVDRVTATTLDPTGPGWRERDEVRFLPAVPDPPTVYCAGANYHDHVTAMAPGQEFAPDSPYHFLVSRQSLAGHGDHVRRPPGCTKLDWEVELAAVIGTRAERVSVDEALDHVAGYTVANDISARDLFVRTDAQPFALDWLRHKSYATFLPLGPAVVPSRFVPDPQAVRLRLLLNGEVAQDSTTEKMVFSVAEQISALSHVAPLVPGDVVCTGTPAGTGHETGRYLSPGDVMRAEIDGVGVLENAVAEG